MRHGGLVFALSLFISTAGCGGEEATCRSNEDCGTGYRCEIALAPGSPADDAETVGVCVPGGDNGEDDDSSSNKGHCDGTQRSCSDFGALWSCRDQAGCYWSFASERCSGHADGCYTYYDNEKKCRAQAGCVWITK